MQRELKKIRFCLDFWGGINFDTIAGDVGGYLAYKLLGCGVDVTIKARGSHFESIEQNGLKVIDVDREDTIHQKLLYKANMILYLSLQKATI